MKLKNKKTGKIKECVVIPVDSNGYPNEYQVFEKGGSLAELNEEWKDYEEPKTFWAISWVGEPEEYVAKNTPEELKNMAKQINNYFETKEEAEQAVLKLKALERLRKNGFRFDGFRQDYTRWSSRQDAFRDGKRYIHFNKADDDDWLKENWEDLKLVFKEDE